MAVGLDAAGNTLLAGSVYGDVALSPSVSVFSEGLFLAAIDPSGTPLWATSPDIFPTSVTIDKLGFIWTTETPSISNKPPTISKLGPDASLSWSREFDFDVDVLAPTGDGGALVMVPFFGVTTLGDITFQASDHVLGDSIIAMLDGDGDVVWGTNLAFGLNPPALPDSFLIVSSNEVAATSDGGALVLVLVTRSIPPAPELRERILRRLGPNGEVLWDKLLPPGPLPVRFVARPNGGALLVANVGKGGSVDLGCGSHVGYGIGLQAIDADGRVEWERYISGDMGTSRPVVDDAGNIVLAGSVMGPVDFGGGKLDSDAPRFRIFVARYAPDGGHVSSQTYEGTPPPGSGSTFAGECRGEGVGMDAQGNVVITGYYSGGLDLGTGPLPEVPNLEGSYYSRGLVARLTPP